MDGFLLNWVDCLSALIFDAIYRQGGNGFGVSAHCLNESMRSMMRIFGALIFNLFDSGFNLLDEVLILTDHVSKK